MMFIALWFELNAGKKAREIVLAAICCHIDFHFTSSDTCLLCMSVMKKLKTKHLTGIIKLQYCPSLVSLSLLLLMVWHFTFSHPIVRLRLNWWNMSMCIERPYIGSNPMQVNKLLVFILKKYCTWRHYNFMIICCIPVLVDIKKT